MSSPQDAAALDRKHKLVIFASSLGTVFEWYDFYIYGTLAVFFGKLFFPPGNETAGFLASLALFGVGFSVRPFGALVFGRIGDLVGRKYTFLVTILVMGLSTALVGVLPTYEKIGFLHVPVESGVYKRANVKMVINIEDAMRRAEAYEAGIHSLTT